MLRIRINLSQFQTDILFNSFINSIFNYCPLVWMFCSVGAHEILNRTHYRALKARYYDFKSTYSELFTRSNSVTLHVRNLRLMLIEIYKWHHNLGPTLFENKLIERNIKYSLRSGVGFVLDPFHKSINSIRQRATLAWNSLPDHVKSSETLEKFASSINQLTIYCKCKFCTQRSNFYF